jgi:hydroxymethylbilane synthase
LYNAVIIAEAGLQRLNMQQYITERLPLEGFTPSSGQGALAVIAKEDNGEVAGMLKRINHPSSMAETLAERAFVREIGGGCKVPIGAIARASSKTLSLYASVLSPDGKVKEHTCLVGDVKSPEKLGVKVAQNLLKMGAGELIQLWRKLYEEG